MRRIVLPSRHGILGWFSGLLLGSLLAGLIAWSLTATAATKRPISEIYDLVAVESVVAPGAFGSVACNCNPGDLVVSGTIVMRSTELNGVHDFRIIDAGKVIDNATGQQKWVLEGINAGQSPIVIRVAAHCAR